MNAAQSLSRNLIRHSRLSSRDLSAATIWRAHDAARCVRWSSTRTTSSSTEKKAKTKTADTTKASGSKTNDKESTKVTNLHSSKQPADLPSLATPNATLLNFPDSFANSLKSSLPSKLASLNAILARPAATSLINYIKSSSSTPTPPILIDGPAGVGKSTVLLETVYHLQSLGNIVVYLPNLWEWCSGWDAFQKVQRVDGSTVYEQKDIAQRVVKRILDFNKAVFEQQGLKNLTGILNEGVKDATKAHDSLDRFLDALRKLPDNAPRVVLAVDQVNALYCNTQYHDTESRPIYAGDFRLVQSLTRYVSGEKATTNWTILLAHDITVTQIASPAFIHHISKCSKLSASTPATSFPVTTPPKYPTRSPPSPVPHLPKAAVYTIPPWGKQEMVTWINHLCRQQQMLGSSNVSEDLAIKKWMICGGVVGRLEDTSAVRGL